MVDLFKVDAKWNPLAQTLARPFGLSERFGSNDLSRTRVGHTKNDFPATFISNSDAVFGQLVEMKIRASTLKLQVLALLAANPFVKS